MLLGEKIKSFRIENKLTQKQLADMVGVSRTNIAEIEGGRLKGTLKFVNKLATATNKPLSYWANEDEIEQTYSAYDALDVLIDAMLDSGMIGKDGKIHEKEGKLILAVLEKEIAFKIKKQENQR